MRLFRSGSVSKQRKNNKSGHSRAKKKHKRLDAICEKAYSQNHGELEPNLGECNGNGDEHEVRRSARVRRAPVVLDASPPPPKKRRKIDKGSGSGGVGSSERRVRRVNLKIESPCSTSRGLEEELSGWRSRLRRRDKKVINGIGSSSSRGKRKLFKNLDGFKEEIKLEEGELDEKNELECEKSVTVLRVNRRSRNKASNNASNGREEIDLGNVHAEIDLATGEEDEEGASEPEVSKEKNNTCLLEGVMKDSVNAAVDLGEQKGIEVSIHLQLEECIANDNVQSVETNKQVEQAGNVEEASQSVSVNDGGVRNGQTEDGICHKNIPLNDEKFKKMDDKDCNSSHKLAKPRIRAGRRCGLCGGGTEGNPPKRLVQDGAGSDNEAYSGSSSSEEPNYDIWDGFGDEPGWLGRLLGPINDRFGIAGIWVHQQCAVWSPEVYFAGLGCLKNVRAALCRGRALKCNRCGRAGATIGCRVDRCPKTYHLPCARAYGCIFDHRKFLIACTDHRHLFQPQGSKFFDKLKKMKAKKMKLEMRKLSNDAWRKDQDAEEKWLENCGEDEEFLKRESKRLHRDLLRIAPVYIGGSKSESEIAFQGWESVGGLQDVIQCLKEVVILPLLYPEFFSNLGLTPPRGVLLHGYPGTGKTLVVRSLIGSCARGDKRIAYFARKGADCLGKYVGDAERQLRLLFQVAEKSQPSIIFFDEIDGLAPSRTRQQDQTHSSVVSTLLALMDGLKSRGSVVVIGATNRPDAIDPALRRPGRFDREIYFPLPSVKDRETILSLHTQKWPKPVTGSLLKWIARRTVGFAGADLQALCTQAAIVALKRSCPWPKVLSAAEEKAPHGKRPPLPTFTVEERDWLEALSCAPPPCSRREAGMAANDVISSPLPAHLLPCLLQPLSSLLVSFYLNDIIWLPQPLSKAVAVVKTVIVSALNKKKGNSDCWWSHVHELLQEADVASDMERNLSRASVLVGDASFAALDALHDDPDDESTKFELSQLQNRPMQTSFLRSVAFASRKKSGFCLLIAGSPRSGQRHLASCVLHSFVGNVEIRKVDLATISQEGGGDLVLGLTQILMRCAGVGFCAIFMPRIDLWALETCDQSDKEENNCPSTDLGSSEDNASILTKSEIVDKENKSVDMEEHQDPDFRVSYLWCSFVEQVESMFVSTSLMVLATSEVPSPLLPLRIRQFFRSDVPNISPSKHLEDTVPRFSVKVDENFDRDMVINSSAAKLSKDVSRYFVQLIHRRTHNYTSSVKEDEAFSAFEGDVDTCHPEPAMEHGTKNQYLLSLPPSKKNVKGKSNLLLAISTFGYQILQYPHFAELCWVTSKLKEGPCTEIGGPWKGWSFNSCIIRPSETSEKLTLGLSSSIIKSKETYGLVRGLIAVGLSAYRGVYTSLREVSSEVRKVLEILTLQINAKIQAGKDRYQFIRVLSQVAYLEDMVNNWAYTLQSLEVDAQLTEGNPKLTCVVSQDMNNTCEDNLVKSDECKIRSSDALELLEECTPGVVAKDIGCPHVTGGDGSSSRPASVADNPNPVAQLQSSLPSLNQLDDKLRIEQNGVNLEPSRLGSSGNHLEFGSMKHSNGFVCIDSVGSPEDAPCISGDMGGVKVCGSGKDCIQDNGLSSGVMNIPSYNENPKSCVNNNDIDMDVSTNRDYGFPTGPGGVCLYHFCSECLYDLYHLIRKILIYQQGMKVSNWTTEEVHDVVTSLSLNLHSAVIKFCLSECQISSVNKNLEHEKFRRFSEGQEMGVCQCKFSGNIFTMAMECSCHSQSNSSSAQEKSSMYPSGGLDSELIFRDGVLATLDPAKDVSFHCKVQRICLCSLIEYIVMTKQPSD